MSCVALYAAAVTICGRVQRAFLERHLCLHVHHYAMHGQSSNLLMLCCDLTVT